MIEYTYVESEIMKSIKETAVYGLGSMVKDLIIWKNKGVIIGLVEFYRLEDHTRITTMYGIYSPITQTAIPEGSMSYQAIVDELPDLSSYHSTKTQFDAVRWVDLRRRKKACVADYANTWQVSENYREIIEEMAKMHDADTQKFYRFFIDQL